MVSTRAGPSTDPGASSRRQEVSRGAWTGEPPGHLKALLSPFERHSKGLWANATGARVPRKTSRLLMGCEEKLPASFFLRNEMVGLAVAEKPL